MDYATYLNVSEIVLSKLLAKTNQTYQSLSHQRFINLKNENYILTEDYYQYLTWFDFKTKLQFQRVIKNQPGILKYGLYYAELGQNIGSEINKLRPVLIFRKCVSNVDPNDSSYIVLPITSKPSAAKYNINYPITVNGKINYVKTNDIQRISLKRIIQPLVDSSTNMTIVISIIDIQAIKTIIKHYLVDYI